MKDVLQRRLTFTPVPPFGNSKPVTVDSLTAMLEFRYENGFTEVNSPNMRCWVTIKETEAEINAMLSAEPKKYKIRGSSQIIIEGNNDKNKQNY